MVTLWALDQYRQAEGADDVSAVALVDGGVKVDVEADWALQFIGDIRCCLFLHVVKNDWQTLQVVSKSNVNGLASIYLFHLSSFSGNKFT